MRGKPSEAEAMSSVGDVGRLQPSLARASN